VPPREQAGNVDIKQLGNGERGWTRQQAYASCSVAVDLKISQLVDAPNMLVSAFLPEDISPASPGWPAAPVVPGHGWPGKDRRLRT
jgi:acetamidase/formamidase